MGDFRTDGFNESFKGMSAGVVSRGNRQRNNRFISLSRYEGNGISHSLRASKPNFDGSPEPD